MTEEERQALIAGLKAALIEQTKEATAAAVRAQEDIARYTKVQENTKEQIAELNTKGADLVARLAEVEQAVAERRSDTPARELSAGELFAKSKQLAEFVQRGGRGRSDAMELKTITSLTGSGGSGIWSQRLPGVVENPLRPLTIRDLLDAGTTTSNLIEWVKELVFTNNADVVSEGTTKPQSNITYAREDVPVRTIAHWIRATRQVLSDFPQLQSLINGRLTWGLKIKEEDQLLLGDGTGENVLGLIPQATAFSGAYNVASDTFIDVIRHAMLQVRLSFYPATGIVLTPKDWHHIELTKDNENRYLMANPAGQLPAMLWGLPVVQSDAMPSDQFMVGSFRLAATVFDREQASIAVSTEDGNNFTQNLVTILCEERLALAVSRPTSFVAGGFPAGSTT